MTLAGRAAVITGAGQGLGASIAEHFVREGASVVLCARNEDSLRQVQDRLAPLLSDGQRVVIQQADVADPASVESLMATALTTFPTLEILVNNAGVYGPVGPVEDVDWTEWAETIRINLLGTVHVCRTLLPHFKRQRYGKIVNLSGGGATAPLPRLSAYAASKAAVIRFTETLAQEVRDWNIDVNAIAPGALDTRLLDQVIAAGREKAGETLHRRMVEIKNGKATPLDVGAAACAYLGSSKSDGITGKLVSAVWDPWRDLHVHKQDLSTTDVYTLRRVTPKDRGLTWGTD